MTTGAGLTAWQRFRKTFKRDGALHVMLLLPLLLLILYHYVPMAGIIIGFKNYKGTKGIFGSTWVGFENFQTLFQTSGFARALRNTVIIAVWKIVLQIAVPVSFSLLLNEMNSQGTKRVIQSIIYLPHFISWVIMASIVGTILSPATGVVINSATKYCRQDIAN